MFRLMSSQLLRKLIICSLLTICNLVMSRFGFECGIYVLITSVPGHCLLVTLLREESIYQVSMVFVHLLMCKN